MLMKTSQVPLGGSVDVDSVLCEQIWCLQVLQYIVSRYHVKNCSL